MGCATYTYPGILKEKENPSVPSPRSEEKEESGCSCRVWCYIVYCWACCSAVFQCAHKPTEGAPAGATPFSDPHRTGMTGVPGLVPLWDLIAGCGSPTFEPNLKSRKSPTHLSRLAGWGGSVRQARILPVPTATCSGQLRGTVDEAIVHLCTISMLVRGVFLHLNLQHSPFSARGFEQPYAILFLVAVTTTIQPTLVTQ